MKKKIIITFLVTIFIVTLLSIIWNFPKKYHALIPVKLSIGGIPLIKIEIQNQKYLLEMDLGSKFQLTLSKDALNRLSKKESSRLLSRDMHGNKYEALSYKIPLIKVADFSFADVIVREQSEDFILNTTYWMDMSRSDDPFEDRTGTIGRGLLEQRNLLLDFCNRVIFISNHLKRLKEAGYRLEEFKKCSFRFGRTGIILPIHTDFGKVRFSLDTGSTISFIRSSFVQNRVTEKKKHGLPFIATRTFEIADKDFGNMDLYLQSITPELTEIDGILGMDFLKNHVVYIDYKNKVLYFGESKHQKDF